MSDFAMVILFTNSQIKRQREACQKYLRVGNKSIHECYAALAPSALVLTDLIYPMEERDSKDQNLSPGSQLYKWLQRNGWVKLSCPLLLQKGLVLALHFHHPQFHFAIKFSRTSILFGILAVSAYLCSLWYLSELSCKFPGAVHF